MDELPTSTDCYTLRDTRLAPEFTIIPQRLVRTPFPSSLLFLTLTCDFCYKIHSFAENGNPERLAPNKWRPSILEELEDLSAQRWRNSERRCTIGACDGERDAEYCGYGQGRAPYSVS